MANEPWSIDALKAHLPLILGLFFTYKVAKWLSKGIKYRRMLHNQPGPKHSWFWGHLISIDTAMKEFPKDVHPWRTFSKMAEDNDLTNCPVYYLDIWPADMPLMMVMDPGVATQIQNKHKNRVALDRFGSVLGHDSLVSANGPTHKELRNMFNPGFSYGNIISLLPYMIQQIHVFLKVLRQEMAANNGFIHEFEKNPMALAGDIIFVLAIGLNTGCQESEYPLLSDYATLSWWPHNGWQPVKLDTQPRQDMVLRSTK